MCNSVLRKIEQKCHNKLNTVIINSTDVGNKKKRGRAHAACHAPTIPTTTTLTYSVQCDDDDDQYVYKRANHSRIKHHQIFYQFYHLFFSPQTRGHWLLSLHRWFSNQLGY